MSIKKIFSFMRKHKIITIVSFLIFWILAEIGLDYCYRGNVEVDGLYFDIINGDKINFTSASEIDSLNQYYHYNFDSLASKYYLELLSGSKDLRCYKFDDYFIVLHTVFNSGSGMFTSDEQVEPDHKRIEIFNFPRKSSRYVLNTYNEKLYAIYQEQGKLKILTNRLFLQKNVLWYIFGRLFLSGVKWYLVETSDCYITEINQNLKAQRRLISQSETRQIVERLSKENKKYED